MSDRFRWTFHRGDSAFEVLHIAKLPLLGAFWWHMEELDEPGLKGTIFRAYETKGQTPGELGYVLVGTSQATRTSGACST